MTKKENINYSYSKIFKTSKPNPSKEELVKIFNQKLFKIIVKTENLNLGEINE